MNNLFHCPNQPQQSSSSTPSPSLIHFITYLHCIRLASSMTFAALYLLQRLKTRFITAHGFLGHHPSSYTCFGSMVISSTYHPGHKTLRNTQWTSLIFSRSMSSTKWHVIIGWGDVIPYQGGVLVHWAAQLGRCLGGWELGVWVADGLDKQIMWHTKKGDFDSWWGVWVHSWLGRDLGGLGMGDWEWWWVR